jgi:hypothetical protein
MDLKVHKEHKLTDPSWEFEINENGIQKQFNRTTRRKDKSRTGLWK